MRDMGTDYAKLSRVMVLPPYVKTRLPRSTSCVNPERIISAVMTDGESDGTLDKLVYMYLFNDVVQNSRKKHEEDRRASESTTDDKVLPGVRGVENVTTNQCTGTTTVMPGGLGIEWECGTRFCRRTGGGIERSKRKKWTITKLRSYVLPSLLPPDNHARHTPPETQSKVLRVINILEERGVYKANVISLVRERIAVLRLLKFVRNPIHVFILAPFWLYGVKPLLALLQELHRGDVEISHISDRCAQVPTKFFNETVMRNFVGTPDATVAAGEVGSAINQLDQLRERTKKQREEKLRCVAELKKLADEWEKDVGWEEKVESINLKIAQLTKVHGHLTGLATSASTPSPVTANPASPSATANGETPMLFEPRTPDYDPDSVSSRPTGHGTTPRGTAPLPLPTSLTSTGGLPGLEVLGDADLDIGDMGAFLDFGGVGDMGMVMGMGGMGMEYEIGGDETTEMKPPSPEPLTPPGE
ncbi:hypothetical protein HDU93_009239 [Gonapodya sp. JEL0774]|nr:hypothetical protein HDU93_009239 [Gonapodya sp. JEL0774]